MSINDNRQVTSDYRQATVIILIFISYEQKTFSKQRCVAKHSNANQNQIIYKSTFSKSSVEFYSLNETDVKIEVLFDSDTVWLNRQQLSVLFGRDIKTIGKHINNSLHEELLNCSVVASFATTAWVQTK